MDNNETLNAFDSVVGQLLGNANGGRDFPIMNPPVDDEEEVVASEETPSSFKDERTIKDTEPVNTEKIVDEEEIIADDIKETEEEVVEEESVTPEKIDEGLGEMESEITAFFQEKLYEKFGWEPGEEDKFEKVEDLVNYLEKVVEANSTPSFASKEIEDLNKFVNDGGNVKDFFSKVYGEFDIDKVSIDKETDQIRVIKETLKLQGFDNDKIEKRIKRYEDTGTLEDEASDAFDILKKHKQELKEKLLTEQTNIKKQAVEQQQKFYTDVTSSIDTLDSVKGIKISKAEKEKLKDFIFKPGNDGRTEYQKEYAKSFKNLIESAYFTMKGDSLIKDMTKQAESQATKNLKDKLLTKTKKGKETGDYEDESKSTSSSRRTLDLFASFVKPQ